MTIAADQLQFFLSGGAINTDPNYSIGGAISSAPVLGVLNNLFRDVNSDEASLGRTDYRCVYIKNTSSSASLYEAEVYVFSQSSGGSNVVIGISPSPVGTTAPLLAVDTLNPSGVAFQETSPSSRISIGTIGPNSAVPVWIKRTTSAGTSFKELDNFVLKITGKPFA